jgi:hypothetical protein
MHGIGHTIQMKREQNDQDKYSGGCVYVCVCVCVYAHSYIHAYVHTYEGGPKNF